MDPEFWHARWTANQIGFHQQTVNAHLQLHWHGLSLRPGSRILVPLCGKSLDMIWLREQGHRVIGIEISPLAVSAFFSENSLPAQVREDAGYPVWSCDGIEIHCSDFFTLTTGQLGILDGCYDRAALIALPEDLRQRYADHLARLLPPDSRSLLVTMEYPQQEMNGPPFAVAALEVTRLFSTHFALQHLEAFDALAANPELATRGASQLVEHIWRLQRS